MDLGTMTLLELNQGPQGKRVAFCLPTGEFISATAESASCFSSAASPCLKAQELYGRNLCQFLAPQDIEKLEDYMRGHCATQQGKATMTFMASSELQMMVRVQETGLPIWIRMTTIPLTLRMSRCIDAVQSMYNPMHLFADSSSFVVSEEDLATALPVMQQPTRTSSSSLESYSAGSSLASPNTSDFYIPSGDEGSALWSDKPILVEDAMLPLELKDSPRHYGRDRRHGKRTESSVSTELADDEELSAEDESLADFAFEADWAGEVAHEPHLKRSFADLSLRAAPVN